MRQLSVRPAMRTASSSLSTPSASASAVNSGTSKLTFTWLCAARLYISSGLISMMRRMRLEESVMSPQCRLIRRLRCMSRTHSSRYRCSMRPVLKLEERLSTPCTSYPFSMRNSARNDPSWPVIPVIKAVFIASVYFSVMSNSTEPEYSFIVVLRVRTASLAVG